MNLVIFGRTVSSSWGNGHATLWRALIAALTRQDHTVTFYERNVPYYAEYRDLTNLPDNARLVLYSEWSDIAGRARRYADHSDAASIASYCPDALAASGLVLGSCAGVKAFHDLDDPVTPASLDLGQQPAYLPGDGLGEFDLVMSYTGGAALTALTERLGAKRAVAIFGSVDSAVHCPAAARGEFQADLSYLGTYAADRQAALSELFLKSSRRMPERRFVIGGAHYPADFPWADTVYFVRHLPAADHPAFYCSSRLTLNVTREAMAPMNYCPSGRLFEATACGVPIVTDWWEGLDRFYVPGVEIIVASSAEDVVQAIDRPDETLQDIANRARARTLAEHTSDHRARQMVEALSGAGGQGGASGRPERVAQAVEA